MYIEITDIVDATRLQAALDSMVQWAETWQLKLSIDKCCVLHIGQYRTASSSVLSSLHSYTVCGHQLPVVTHCRDLGVIANNCQPRLHINVIILLKLVNVQTPYCVVFKVVILVFCYVPLKFMYDQFWNITPLFGRLYKRKTSKSVQRRFTKRLSGLAYSYSDIRNVFRS